ncbi:abortive phage resistance protein [Acinetobacter wuhouensis]|jgi:hypothetical protein|uniref:abortive infection family protein n=1 Tax=Acinetobacter wuhouensis TaxID=1879050 RepID=UPI00083B4DF9|nr:abortive infection family protein [Acinetobacter wuhouensis]AXQ21984.1 abortive phage resistance protein [Acinetobacter wuhouensis]
MDNREKILKVESMQNLLIAHATGSNENSSEYETLRFYLLKELDVKGLLPKYVMTCRNLQQFWQYIKYEYATYGERREFIWKSFQPILDKLELNDLIPSDQLVTDIVHKIDSEYIHNIWQKALERRSSDPEGAITLARTLLESTCKYILDEYKVEYGNSPDINQLYRLVGKELNLSPSQHTEQTFKQILGGCTSIVEGLGSLRNKVGDAHGQGKKNFKPSARHAELAVNLAGTMAVFLFSSWNLKNE